MPQSVVRNRTAGMHGGHSGCRQVTVPLPAQRRSAYGERNAAVPTGMALGDFYRLGNKVQGCEKSPYFRSFRGGTDSIAGSNPFEQGRN